MKHKPQVCLGMMGAIDQGASTLNAAIGKVTTERNPAIQPGELTPYIASLRRFPTQRVGVHARNCAEAKELLEQMHGKGNVILVRRVDDGGELPR